MVTPFNLVATNLPNRNKIEIKVTTIYVKCVYVTQNFSLKLNKIPENTGEVWVNATRTYV